MMSMRQNSLCTPEYFVWITKEDQLARPSREGLAGLEDSRAALQVYNRILPHYLVTPTMHQQVVQGSIDHILLLSDDDNRIVEYIQIEFEEELEEDPEEELEYNLDDVEEEFEEA